MTQASFLVSSAVAPSTASQYRTYWLRYLLFCKSFPGVYLPPSLPSTLALFITSLVSCSNPLSPSSVTSIVSALGYQFKLFSFPDPTSSFVIRKILSGLTKANPSVDSRLPVTPSILLSIISTSRRVASSPFELALFPALFSLMFHALLRLGEVTDSPHNLQYSNLSLTTNALSLTFTSFKHSLGHPVTITLQASASPACPVRLIHSYLTLRGHSPGPLFMSHNRSPLNASYFRSFLKSSLALAGLSSLRITPHSFRIGAATYAASMGFTSEQIKTLGRWRSAAFKKYIRIQAITLKASV